MKKVNVISEIENKKLIKIYDSQKSDDHKLITLLAEVSNYFTIPIYFSTNTVIKYNKPIDGLYRIHIDNDFIIINYLNTIDETILISNIDSESDNHIYLGSDKLYSVGLDKDDLFFISPTTLNMTRKNRRK